jgi:hypothetical protein
LPVLIYYLQSTLQKNEFSWRVGKVFRVTRAILYFVAVRLDLFQTVKEVRAPGI